MTRPKLTDEQLADLLAYIEGDGSWTLPRELGTALRELLVLRRAIGDPAGWWYRDGYGTPTTLAESIDEVTRDAARRSRHVVSFDR